LGSNWLNPAAGGWLFIRCAWPAAFSRALEASPLSVLTDSLGRGAVSTGGSPFDIIKINSPDFSASLSGIDAAIRSFLNNTVFYVRGAEITEGYIDHFNMAQPGIIADRGMLALLAGTIIITSSRVNRSWIPLVWLGVYVFLVRLAGALPYGGEWWRGDILFALSTGGVIPAAFILSADPATGAKSNWGILAAAALSGCLAWFFRYRGGEPYGAVFAVVTINAILPLVRAFERKVLYEKRGSPTALQDASLMSDNSTRRSIS
jgi:electron transport complex protein RnfD